MDPGLLPVDKPIGPTSHDVVAMARRAFSLKRIGHTGTLDPFASGLLILCLGPATRLAEFWSGADKSYEAEVTLGRSTNTLDLQGEDVARDEAWRRLTAPQVTEAAHSLKGTQQQRPPAFSAKKVAGVRAYQKARAGEQVVLEPVKIVVHDIAVTEVALPVVRFEVRCSSGTYVRALARDLGVRLGTGAHLSALRRTKVAEVHVDAAVPPGEFDDPERVRGALIAPRQAVPDLPTVELGAADAERARTGQALTAPANLSEGRVALVQGATLVAVADASGGKIHPKKVFHW